MKDKPCYFNQDYERGKVGVENFLKSFPDARETDGRTHDIIRGNGETWEIKTEYYNSRGNIAIEIYSDRLRRSLGGLYGPYNRILTGMPIFL